MKKKKLRKKIESLNEMIEEHKRKIEAEDRSHFPMRGA
jgi:hypothetical protein